MYPSFFKKLLTHLILISFTAQCLYPSYSWAMDSDDESQTSRLIDDKNDKLNRQMSGGILSQDLTGEEPLSRQSSISRISHFSDFFDEDLNLKPLSLPILDNRQDEFKNQSNSHPSPSFTLKALLEDQQQQEDFLSSNSIYEDLRITEAGIFWSNYGFEFFLESTGKLFLQGKHKHTSQVLRVLNPNGEVYLAEDLVLEQLLVKASTIYMDKNSKIKNLHVWATGEEENNNGIFGIDDTASLESLNVTVHQGRLLNRGSLTLEERGALNLNGNDFTNQGDVTLEENASVKKAKALINDRAGTIYSKNASLDVQSLYNHHLIHSRGDLAVHVSTLFQNEKTGSLVVDGKATFSGTGSLIIEEGINEQAGIAIEGDLVFEDFDGEVINKGSLVSVHTIKGTISKLSNHKNLAVGGFDKLYIEELLNTGTLQANGAENGILNLGKGTNNGLIQGDNLFLKIDGFFENEENALVKSIERLVVKGQGHFMNRGQIESPYVLLFIKTFENETDLDLGEGTFDVAPDVEKFTNLEGVTLQAKKIMLRSKGKVENNGNLFTKLLENSSKSFVNEGIVEADRFKHKGGTLDNTIGSEFKIGVLEEFNGKKLINDGEFAVKRSTSSVTLQTLENSGKFLFLAPILFNIQKLLNTGTGLVHSTGKLSGTIGHYEGKKDAVLQSTDSLEIKGQTLLLEGKILTGNDLSYTASDSFKVLKSGEMVAKGQLTATSSEILENKGALSGAKGLTIDAVLDNTGIVKGNGSKGAFTKKVINSLEGFIEMNSLTQLGDIDNKGHMEIGFLFGQDFFGQKGAINSLNNTGKFILKGGKLNVNTLQNRGTLKAIGDRFKVHLLAEHWDNENGTAEVHQLTLSSLSPVLKGKLKAHSFTPLKAYNSLTNLGKTKLLSGGFESKQTKNTGILSVGNGTYRIGSFTNTNPAYLILLKGSKTYAEEVDNDGLIESPTGLKWNVSKVYKKSGKFKTKDDLIVKIAPALGASDFLFTYANQWDVGRKLRVEADAFHNYRYLQLSVPFHLKTQSFQNVSKIVSPGFKLKTNSFINGSTNEVFGEIKSEGPLSIIAKGTIDNRFGQIQSKGKAFIKSINGDVATGYQIMDSRRKDSYVPVPVNPWGKPISHWTDETMPIYKSNGAFIASSGDLTIEGQNVVTDFGGLLSMGSMHLKAPHQIRTHASNVLVGKNLTVSGGWYLHNVVQPLGMNHYNYWNGRAVSWVTYSYLPSEASLTQVLGNIYFEVSRVTLDSSHLWTNGNIFDQRAPGCANPLHLFEQITHKRTYYDKKVWGPFNGDWWQVEYAMEVPTIRFGQTLAIGGAGARFVITGNVSGNNMFFSGQSLDTDNVQPAGTYVPPSYTEPQLYDLGQLGYEETQKSPFFKQNAYGVNMITADPHVPQDAYDRNRITLLNEGSSLSSSPRMIPPTAHFFLQRDASHFILNKTLGKFAKSLNLGGFSGTALTKKLHENSEEIALREGKGYLTPRDIEKATASMILYELRVVEEKMKLMAKLLIVPKDFNEQGGRSGALVAHEDIEVNMSEYDASSGLRKAGRDLKSIGQGAIIRKTLKDKGSEINADQERHWEAMRQQVQDIAGRDLVHIGSDIVMIGAHSKSGRKTSFRAKNSIVDIPLMLESSNKTNKKVSQEMISYGSHHQAGEELDMVAEEGNIRLTGVKVQTPEATLKALKGRIELMVSTNTSSSSEILQDCDILWQKTIQRDEFHQTHVACLFTGNLTMESPEKVIESVRGQTLDWIERLKNKNDTTINFIVKDEIHRTDEKTLQQGPTPALCAVIALAAGIATAGVGSTWGAALAGKLAVEGSLAASVISGMTIGAVSSISAHAALALVNAKGDIGEAARILGKKETFKAVLISMATSGALHGIAHQLGVPLNLNEKSPFIAHFKKAMLNSTVGMGRDIATGEKLERALEIMIRATATDSIQGFMAGQIGAAYDSKNQELNFATHKIAHAFLGGMSGVILSKDMEQGAIAGAMGAFVAETFADLAKPDKPTFTKVAEMQQAKGGRLNEKEFNEAYQAEMKEYGEKVKQIAGFSKIAAATSLMLTKKDVNIGAHIGTNAVDNNFVVLAYYGVMAAGVAWTAYDVISEYNTHGPEAALKKLGIDLVIGVATGGALKVGGKIAYKVGQVAYPSMSAALEAALGKVPGLQFALSGMMDKLVKGGEKLAQSKLGQGVAKVEQKLVGMENKVAEGLGFGGGKKQVRFNEDAKVNNVWSKGPVVRGEEIEKALGQNLHQNFPVIDRFENGVVTSIKSLDLRAPTYQDPTKLRKILNGYVDKVADFNGKDFAENSVPVDQILSRALDLAIPHAGNNIQQEILKDAAKYAASKGVVLNIISF